MTRKPFLHRSPSAAAVLAFTGFLTAGTLIANAATGAATTTSSTVRTQFNPVVQQAMAYVWDRTDMPLQAPTYVGGHLGGGSYLTALVTASAHQYAVNLQTTTTPMSINNPAINDVSNNGLANIVGSYGSKLYSSASAAQAAFYRYVIYDFASANTKMRTVNLLHGIQGTLTEDANEAVTWQEGNWRLQVQGGPQASNVALARQLVGYLNQYLLPETHGVLTVENAGDGEHTNLVWAFGKQLYYASDYHIAKNAVKMAMSMRGYRVPNSQQFPGAIREAMREVVKQSSIPPQAPRQLGDGFSIGGPREGSLSAQVSFDSEPTLHQYVVNLYDGKSTSAASQIGWFGGRAFRNHTEASQFVGQLGGVPKVQGETSRPIYLGHGITGRAYNVMGMVAWHEGNWQLNVQAGSEAQDARLARQVVAYLHTHLLPESHGFMTIKNTPAAQFTNLEWVWGPDVYSAYSDISAKQALTMAVSYAGF